MTTIMKSNSSYKRVVDKAEDDDDGHWPVAKLSVQEEDLNGPDVKGNEEPIEQAAGWDIEAQARSSTSQDKMTAGIKSPSIQGHREAAVVERNSLRQQSIQTCNSSPATTAASFASSEAPIDRIQRVLVDGQTPETKAAARSDSILGWLRPSCLTATHLNVKTKASRSQAFRYEYMVNPYHKPDDSTQPSYFNPSNLVRVKVPVEVDDWHSVFGMIRRKTKTSRSFVTQFEYIDDPSREPVQPSYFNPSNLVRVKVVEGGRHRLVPVPMEEDDEQDDGHEIVSVFGTIYRKKQPTLFGKVKKSLPWIVVGIIMIVIGLGLVMPNGDTHRRLGTVPFVDLQVAPTSDIDTMAAAVPIADFGGGNDKQEEGGAVSKTQATDTPSIVPTSALAVYLPPFPIAFPSKAEDWIPTWPSLEWKHESDPTNSKAVAIVQVSGTEAPAAIWKLSFEYFELEETGDVHVGIVCDTDFTGAYDTSKILYGGPAPLFFKSRTVSHDEVTLVHSVDWHTGLPLITVGFGVNRFDRITIVCGDMPSTPPAIERDVLSTDSTSLALFQGPTDIATSAKGFPSVQAVPVHWVHLPVGDSCDGKALVVWRSGTTKQDSISESKALQLVDGEVKAPTGSQAFVVTFDIFLLQGRASLDIHLECVYKNTMQIGLESTADNPQVLFLSHTFSKHQVDVSVRGSGNQSLVTIGFWEDKFGITAICEDFDAIGSNSAEEARATAMMASPQPQQPEPPASKANCVCCGLKLLLFLAMCGMALAVKQIPKRRIDQAPPRQAAPPDQVPGHPAASSVQVPCQRAASSAQVPCPGADPSYASSSKKAKPLSILKPRIRKVNKDSIRFDQEVTVREYHRTVGVCPNEFRTDYALALDWTFAERKATMESFGHGRTVNGGNYRVGTPIERRNLLMEAGIDAGELEHLERRAQALRVAGANRQGT